MNKLLLATIALLGVLLPQTTVFANADTLTIGTIVRPPFVMVDEVASSETDRQLTGFSVELWDAIGTRAGIDYQWQEFTVFGDMIDAVTDNTIDAAIANISVTADREQILDYSQPIYDAGLQVLIPAQSDTKSFIKVIWESGIIWFFGFALGVLLVIAHIVWLVERGVIDKRHDYFRDDYFGGVWDAFWWAFIIMTMGGFENEVPHKKLSRIIAIFWIVASLFFISTLTAKITTSLTVSQLQSDIASYEDLVGKRVGVSTSPTAKGFLTNHNIAVTEYEKLEELFADLTNGNLDAVVQDAPIVTYFATHKGKGQVTVVGEVFKPEKYAIAIPENSPHFEIINQALQTLKEDGTYTQLLTKYFGK